MTSQLTHVPFAQVPEWVLDHAEHSDRAVRLFAVLHRYADTGGNAFPGRRLLAKRMHCSSSSLDRALDELIATGAVATVPRYREDGSQSSNDYWLWPATPPVTGGVSTGEEGGLPSDDQPPSPPVTSQEQEPEERHPDEREPDAGASAGDPPADEARELVTAFWDWCKDSGRPTPTLPARGAGNPFMALVGMVRTLLGAGWEAREIKHALKDAPTYTVAALTFQLNRRRAAAPTTGARAPVTADRNGPAGRVEL